MELYVHKRDRHKIPEVDYNNSWGSRCARGDARQSTKSRRHGIGERFVLTGNKKFLDLGDVENISI